MPVRWGGTWRSAERQETLTLWDGGHGCGGWNQRGEDGGGSLSGREHREVGSVWGEAQGLLAWVLVEALFSTQMINTRVSAVYFDGKLYLCLQYFSEITCIRSVQFHSVAQSCPTLQPYGLQQARLPVHHQLLEFTQTHVHRVSDAIQPFHSLSSPSPPAPNPSQHQSIFQ